MTVVAGVARVTDHVEQGLERLLVQYKNKPRLRAWLSAYLKQVQDLEDAIFEMRVKRFIDSAEGVQLDIIGRVVGEGRNSRDDALFRLFLRARIRINRSLGTNKDIFDVMGIISSSPFTFLEYPPATLAIELSEIPDFDPVLLLGLVREAKAGGVGISFVVPTTDPDHEFLWMSVGDTSDPAHGFGDSEAPDDDGLLSDAVTMRGTL